VIPEIKEGTTNEWEARFINMSGWARKLAQ
jgi:hypothetical protein